MKSVYGLIAGFLLYSGAVFGTEVKALLDVAPSVAELGQGWTTRQVQYLIDPKSHPSQIGPEQLLKTTREMMARTGREAYARITYGHVSMTNHDCHVYLQRWPSAEALRKHEFARNALPDKTPPGIGQEAYWSGGPFVSGLTFRLDQYLVVIEAWASDHARILRLARVIEAKLAGKPIPHDVNEGSDPKNGQAGTAPNTAEPPR